MAAPTAGQEDHGRCLFCGELGSSLEHIFGDWLGREIVKPTTARHYRYAGARGKVEERTANGLALTGQVKAPCYTCNNGWMSVIEDRAKPLLLSMMRGQAQDLSPWQQKTLAVWLCIKSMCMEREEAMQTKAIPPDDYAFMYRNREPALWRLPNDWFVWAGTSNADFGKVGAFQASLHSTVTSSVTKTDFAIAAYSSVLVSGAFVGIVFRSPFPGDGPLFSEQGTEIFRPLWPLVASSYWPPPFVFPYQDVWAIPENILDAMVESLG